MFDIELTEYTDKNYAESYWKKLVQQEEVKDRDSDIEIIEIEIKDKNQKKRPKPVDPEDEYDLDDDFIDDSEVNDEEVPDALKIQKRSNGSSIKFFLGCEFETWAHSFPRLCV